MGEVEDAILAQHDMKLSVLVNESPESQKGNQNVKAPNKKELKASEDNRRNTPIRCKDNKSSGIGSPKSCAELTPPTSRRGVEEVVKIPQMFVFTQSEKLE